MTGRSLRSNMHVVTVCVKRQAILYFAFRELRCLSHSLPAQQPRTPRSSRPPGASYRAGECTLDRGRALCRRDVVLMHIARFSPVWRSVGRVRCAAAYSASETHDHSCRLQVTACIYRGRHSGHMHGESRAPLCDGKLSRGRERATSSLERGCCFPEQARAREGKCVLVCGHLFSWAFPRRGTDALQIVSQSWLPRRSCGGRTVVVVR